MIPKVIHYVWVGGKPLTPLAEKCIESWKKHCKGYEIKRWDETNFDVSSNVFCKEAYENKKWAFVADYIRLKILYDEGGIYMDTDVETIKPLDNYLNNKAFVGLEFTGKIQTGIIGAEKGSNWIKLLLNYYESKHFQNEDGTILNMPSVLFVSDLTEKEYNVKIEDKYQELKDVVIYPHEVFCPDQLTEKKYSVKDETVTVHHFAASWVPKSWLFKRKIKSILKSIIIFFIGQKNFEKIREKKKNKQKEDPLYSTLNNENKRRKK